jgi:pseudouridine-5'-phosphate glycosidase
VRGGAVTPHLLEHIAVSTGGRALQANRALAVHNAQIAAAIAGSLVEASL